MKKEYAVQNLNSLKTGQQAYVARILNTDHLMRRRLMDLGFMVGTEITFIRPAPLNDPIEIRLDNAFISLRREEAQGIEVRLK
ncbi:FeoA family protein [Dichelobacter nodosus]|uniref:Iron transport protein FeoA n=1 Tax=Dichelobacter nodosus (strain VCS1703A) TaxID=246195 RepID=A5EWN5_DICNV|nr:FeoA family protein [Dichelobacter nodosus]ABQ14068.1 iron transport protein FeoA [Dichelobacter nodosus VCS1703A]AXM45064.1 ferrous iron transport protein A [Dichelobacter nodosus]KNZ39749.1 hypothetical protein AKG33_02755 [Dichelobacter nodosus]TGA65911.1 ferrous iron transport protein A [Dichelobacter nodosus]